MKSLSDLLSENSVVSNKNENFENEISIESVRSSSEKLIHSLFYEELRLKYDQFVDFRQFPLILYAYSEDGYLISRIKNVFSLNQFNNDEKKSEMDESITRSKSDVLSSVLLDDLYSSMRKYDTLSDSLKYLVDRRLHNTIESSNDTMLKYEESKGDTIDSSMDYARKTNFTENDDCEHTDFSYDFISKQLESLCNPHGGNTSKHRPFESKVNEKYQDEYNMDFADAVYLERKQKNFIIFNKPGIDCILLMKKLSEQYGVVVIEPKHILTKELSNYKSALQEQLLDELRCGKAIRSRIIFELILNEIASNEVQKKGYVLSGVPMFGYSSSPQIDKSEYIPAHEQLEKIFGVANKPNTIIYMFCPNEDLIRLRSLTNTDLNTGQEHNSGISKICSSFDIEESKNTKLIKSGNKSIISNMKTENSIHSMDEKNSKENNESVKINKLNANLRRNYSDLKNTNVPDDYILECMLEDFQNVASKLSSNIKSIKVNNLSIDIGLNLIKEYHCTISPLIDEYIFTHDPQYFIKLDGRFPTKQNFEILLVWLKRLCIQKPCHPITLKDFREDERSSMNSNEENSENEEIPAREEDIDMKNPSAYEAFRTLNCISPFEWKISEWGSKCPVSLFYGKNELGKAKFSVSYLDKIYFLKSRKCLQEFLQNPQMFIKLPNPKPIHKFIICGFLGTNKTETSKIISNMYSIQYVDFNMLMKEYVAFKKEKLLNKFKSYAKSKANDLFDKIKNEIVKEKKESWKDRMYLLIKDKINQLKLEQAQSDSDLAKNVSSHSESIEKILDDVELCEQILTDRELLNEYVPTEIGQNVEDEYMQNVELLAESTALGDFNHRLSMEDVKNAILDMDLKLSKQNEYNFVDDKLPPYKGWFINNLPLNINLWKLLKDESDILSNYILYLYNSSEILDDEVGQMTIKKTPQLNLFDINEAVPAFEPKRTGVTRKQLYTIQENYLKQDNYSDTILSMSRPDISNVTSMVEVNAEEEIREDTVLETIKPKKKITFKLQTEVMEFSNDLIHYEKNDQINSLWTSIKSELFADDSHNILEIDLAKSTDVIIEIEKHILSQTAYPVREMHDVDNDESNTHIAEDLNDFKKFGDTLFYCPVLLKENKFIIKGNVTHAVEYRNRIYYFSKKTNKEKFKNNPELYVNFKEPLSLKDFGPLKICVLATVCGFGEFFCKRLAEVFNITFINFNETFEKNLVPINVVPVGVLYEDPDTRFDLAFEDKSILRFVHKLREYFNTCQSLPQKNQISLLADKYWTLEHPWSNGFVYYRYPHTVDDWKYLVNKSYLPDVFIELKIPEDGMLERIADRVKRNWIIKKGMIKKRTILYDENLKLKYDETRKRVFHFVLNTVWSRELALVKGTVFKTEVDDILEQLEAEINTVPKDKLMEKYSNIKDNALHVNETDSNTLFEAIEVSNHDINQYNIKKIVNPFFHSPSIRNIAIRYGLQLDEIDLKVIQKIHKIVCQIVPKPFYKMKTLNQKVKSPDKDLMSTHEIEKAEIARIKQVANSLNIPWISSYSTDAGVMKCKTEIIKNLRLKDPTVLESTYQVNVETAEDLLAVGYFYFSKFFRWCPVQIYEKNDPIQPLEKRIKNNDVFPVIHRKYIYFIHGKENAMKFKENVLKYIRYKENISTFFWPVRIAIVGPLKSGKSTLARKIADYYDLEVITIGSALRYVKRNLSWTMLADLIELALSQGCTVPYSLIAKSIEVLIHVGKASITGFVLDGVINNETMISELSNLNIVPHLVIQLDVTKERIFSHLRQYQDSFTYKYSEKFVNHKLDMSQSESKYQKLGNRLNQFWENVLFLDPMKTQYDIEIVKSKVNEIYFALNGNYDKIKYSSDRPIPLSNMCVSPFEYDSRLHCIIGNCCVGCVRDDKLFMRKTLDRSNSVQFRNHYFWLCPRHYIPFLQHPEHYLCNLKPEDFQYKPRAIDLGTAENDANCLPMRFENKGFCNTCFWQNFPKRIPIVKRGQEKFAVVYKNKIYLFCCDLCMQKFCQRPHYYEFKEINSTLSVATLLEQSVPVPSNRLPLLGYLHENVADILYEALLSIGHVRPKYVFMSPTLSASLYLGYYIAKKCDSQHDEFIERNFEQFIHRSQALKQMAHLRLFQYNPFANLKTKKKE